MHRYSEEQKEFIITNNYGKYSKELAEMFNQHFNTNITAKEICESFFLDGEIPEKRFLIDKIK